MVCMGRQKFIPNYCCCFTFFSLPGHWDVKTASLPPVKNISPEKLGCSHEIEWPDVFLPAPDLTNQSVKLWLASLCLEERDTCRLGQRCNLFCFAPDGATIWGKTRTWSKRWTGNSMTTSVVSSDALTNKKNAASRMKHKHLRTNKLLQDVKASYVVTAFLFMCPEIRALLSSLSKPCDYITLKTTKSNMDIPSLWFAVNLLSRVTFFWEGTPASSHVHQDRGSFFPP